MLWLQLGLRGQWGELGTTLAMALPKKEQGLEEQGPCPRLLWALLCHCSWEESRAPLSLKGPQGVLSEETQKGVRKPCSEQRQDCHWGYRAWRASWPEGGRSLPICPQGGST